MSQRRFGVALSVISFVFIAAATLTPHAGAPAIESVWCLACGELGGVDLVANTFLFMPLGVGLALALRRRWWPVVVCVAFTLLIEVLQIRVVNGRDASAGDVVANAIGGFLGTWLGLWYARLVLPDRRLARRLVHAWSALLLAVLCLTSRGLSASPRPLSIWIQHTPKRAGFEMFRGTLEAFEIEGIPLSETYPKRGRPIADALAKRSWRATATVTTLGPSSGPAIIARIVEETPTRVSIEQAGSALRCRVKARASDYRLRDPVVQLNDVFVTAGARIRATCGQLGGVLLAEASSTTSSEHRLRLTPALGWLVLSPFVIGVSPRLATLGLAWLFVLLVPAGYWLAATQSGSEPSRWRGVLPLGTSLLVAMVCGLYIAPHAFGVSAASPLEWTAALLGLVAGAGMRRLVARRATGA